MITLARIVRVLVFLFGCLFCCAQPTVYVGMSEINLNVSCHETSAVSVPVFSILLLVAHSSLSLTFYLLLIFVYVMFLLNLCSYLSNRPSIINYETAFIVETSCFSRRCYDIVVIAISFTIPMITMIIIINNDYSYHHYYHNDYYRQHYCCWCNHNYIIL